MILEIIGCNVPQLYAEAIWKMHACAVDEDTRNGKVKTIPYPTILELINSRERVLFDPRRDVNHFFHVMEFIWMMAGEKKVNWLLQFNKNYSQYAEESGDIQGAYGHRWRTHYGEDQILEVIQLLKKDPATRRAVIGMWDPYFDLEPAYKDVPCNTHIYLRIVNGRLDMMVCNRSNDMVWGALGANIVHMTYLHELIAHGIECQIGRYRVLSNNFHMYSEREDFEKIWHSYDAKKYDLYNVEMQPYPLFLSGEKIETFFADCKGMLEGQIRFETRWMNEVAQPMKSAYLLKEKRKHFITQIAAQDWRLACWQWNERRKG